MGLFEIILNFQPFIGVVNFASIFYTMIPKINKSVLCSRLGALFDWDGVIIDSAHVHKKSWELLSSELGMPLPSDHFERGFGRTNDIVFSQILKWTSVPEEIAKLSERKEILYRQLLLSDGIYPLPGVLKLIDSLKVAGIPCAVGSATPRINITELLPILGLKDAFSALVCSDDVTRSKPDPEVFLTAAQRISRLPENCIVFEDATYGLEAARRGGMKAVGVATTYSKDKLASKADLVVDRLSELTLNRLLELF